MFTPIWDGEGREDIAHQAWTANGAYCTVEVRIIDMEDMPCESNDFDEEDYGDWCRNVAGNDDLTQAEW